MKPTYTNQFTTMNLLAARIRCMVKYNQDLDRHIKMKHSFTHIHAIDSCDTISVNYRRETLTITFDFLYLSGSVPQLRSLLPLFSPLITTNSIIIVIMSKC